MTSISPQPEDYKLFCTVCDTRLPPMLSWTIQKNGAVHLRADCPKCGRWLTWLAQTEQWVRKAPRHPFSEAYARLP